MTGGTREPLVGLAERLRASVTYAYMPMAVRRQLCEAATALEEQSREVERLRGLLIDPGDPAWENARGILATEMRKAGHCLHADYVEAAHPAMVPSWLVLNLIALAARTALSPSDTVEKGEDL